MITFVTNDDCFELRGVQADVKNLPKDGKMEDGTIIGNGSYFFAMDTLTVYFYDAKNKRWIEQK